MFQRLADITSGCCDLAAAEAQLWLVEARRSMLWVAAAFIGGATLLVAILGLLTAAAAALTQAWGWVGALTAISAAILLVGAGIVIAALRRVHHVFGSPDQAASSRLKASAARRQIGGNSMLQQPTNPTNPAHTFPAAPGTPAALGKQTSTSSPDPSAIASHPMQPFSTSANNGTQETQNSAQTGSKANDWQEKATQFVVNNPGLVAGAAVTTLAVVGPFRTLRLLGKGMMLAGLANKVLEQMQSASSNGTNGTPAESTEASTETITPDSSTSSNPQADIHGLDTLNRGREHRVNDRVNGTHGGASSS